MKQKSCDNRIVLVLLTALLLLSGVCLCVGNTYSRNNNVENEHVIYSDETSYSWNFTENSDMIATAGVAVSENEDNSADSENVQESDNIDGGEGAIEILYCDEQAALVKILYPENSDSVTLLSNASVFVKGTCYSTDGISVYSLDNDSCIGISDGSELIFIQNPAGNLYEMTGRFYSGDEYISENTVEVFPDDNLWTVESIGENAILGENGAITWKFEKCIEGCLLETEFFFYNGEEYETVDPDNYLTTEITVSGDYYILNVVAESKAPAGTYMLRVTQFIETNKGNVKSLSCDIPFFVNYR